MRRPDNRTVAPKDLGEKASPFKEIKKPNVKAVRESGRFHIIDAMNYGMARIEEGGGKPTLTITIHDKTGAEKYRWSPP